MSDAETLIDTRLVRALAGPDFRRADLVRDERVCEERSNVERWLRDLLGWLPPRRWSQREVAMWSQQIEIAADLLMESDDSAVRIAFQNASVEFRRDASRKDRLAIVLACVGLAAKRRLGLWPHPVQFAGATVLLRGRIAEMQTGEGKTLVAALAACVMAGSGALVHIISTNDYLAQRDCDEMRPMFEFLGLGVAAVVEDTELPERQSAYRQAICYVSGKQVVFDDLKDNLTLSGQTNTCLTSVQALFRSDPSDRLKDATVVGNRTSMISALHFAIVDEADSVLIDEARTPMILSRQAHGPYPSELIAWAIEQARCLRPSIDYELLSNQQIEILPPALDACQPLPSEIASVWRNPVWRTMLLRQALSALHLYLRDRHYVLIDGKVQIVDESTGRIMADRSWEQGLHQLIEAKEGLTLTSGRETLARMTFPRFFRRYYLLAGMTGTATEVHRELWTVYRLPVDRLPPHRPNARRRLPDRCLPTIRAKWECVAAEAEAAANRGQPVLIGTRSVEASEQVAEVLSARGLDYVVLNARQDRDEATIVAAAGRAGRITVATNMAGRGTDIKLTSEARAAGGLHVILTEFHESPRVDRQLFGRSGRQGDPGSICAIVSASDSIFSQYARSLASWLGRPLPLTVKPFLLRATLRFAQANSEREARLARAQNLQQDFRLQSLIGYAGARR